MLRLYTRFSKVATRRSWYVRVSLPLFLVVFVLMLCEGLFLVYYNVVPPKNYNLIAPAKSRLHIFQASQSGNFYSVKPNYEQDFVNHEFQIGVRTNNIGLREDRDFHGEPVDIAFIGDSFTFGWGVEAGERYSDVVRRAYPGKRVLSYSYPNGHSPISYLAFLQAHPELMPRVLVLGLFAFNDLAEDTADAIVERDPDTGCIDRVGSKTYAVDERGFIYANDRPPPDPTSWQGILRNLAIGRTLIVSQHQLASTGKPRAKPEGLLPLDSGQFDETAQLALGHVAALDQLARDQGATLLVFYIPFVSHVGDYPVCLYAPETCDLQRQINPLGEALVSWAERRGIHFIDPLTRFRELEASGQRLHFELDGHWTPTGHAAAGELIVEYLRRNEEEFFSGNRVKGTIMCR